MEALPGRLGEMVRAVVRAQRALAWQAAEAGKEEYWLVRQSRVETRLFLTASESKVVLFFRRPGTEEVVLDARVGFLVEPRLEAARGLRLEAILPRFLVAAMPGRQEALLLAALGESQRERVTFLHLGLFFLAVTRGEDLSLVRAAFLWHGAERADVVFERVGSGKFRYAPVPFLLLLEEVGRWAKSGFREGECVALQPGGGKTVPRMLRALVGAWERVSAEAGRRPAEDPLAELVPDFGVSEFRAEVTLRLQPNGMLAERRGDDRFRLQMAVEQRAEGLRVTAGAPDFLVGGELYERLLAKVREERAVAAMFARSGLGRVFRGAFEEFVAEAEVLIFRAEKQGERDTEVFVFRGDWQGESRALAASLEVVVERGRVKGEARDVQVIFHNLTADGPEPRPEFPLFLLSLVQQLERWHAAFG